MKFCSSCGAELSDKVEFCGNCGQKVGSSPEKNEEEEPDRDQNRKSNSDKERDVSFFEVLNPGSWTVIGWIWAVFGLLLILSAFGGNEDPGAVFVFGVGLIFFAPVIRYFRGSNRSLLKQWISCLGLFFLILVVAGLMIGEDIENGKQKSVKPVNKEKKSDDPVLRADKSFLDSRLLARRGISDFGNLTVRGFARAVDRAPAGEFERWEKPGAFNQNYTLVVEGKGGGGGTIKFNISHQKDRNLALLESIEVIKGTFDRQTISDGGQKIIVVRSFLSAGKEGEK